MITILAPYRFFKHSLHFLKKNKTNNSIINTNEVNIKDKNKNRISLFQNMRQALVLCSIIGRSIIMFIISFIQFWLYDYMTNILNIPSSTNIFLLFTIISFISPLLGTIFQNYISKQFTH